MLCGLYDCEGCGDDGGGGGNGGGGCGCGRVVLVVT